MAVSPSVAVIGISTGKEKETNCSDTNFGGYVVVFRYVTVVSTSHLTSFVSLILTYCKFRLFKNLLFFISVSLACVPYKSIPSYFKLTWIFIVVIRKDTFHNLSICCICVATCFSLSIYLLLSYWSGSSFLHRHCDVGVSLTKVLFWTFQNLRIYIFWNFEIYFAITRLLPIVKV